MQKIGTLTSCLPVEGAHAHIIYFTPSSVPVNNMQYIIKDKTLLTNLYYMYTVPAMLAKPQLAKI